MDYTVWVKEEFGDMWMPHVCGDVAAAKRKVLDASKMGKEVRMTVEVPFEVQLKVGEPGAEVKKPKPKEKEKAAETTQEEVEVETDKDPAE